MKADFLALSALCAANPRLSEALQTSNPSVAALANCNVIDKSLAGMSDSLLDFINKLSLYEGGVPFTASPVRPLAGLSYPAEMAIAPQDVVVPIRYTLPSTGSKVTPVPIATIDPTIRFSNNTVSGAIDVDIYALGFNGAVMPNYTRRTVLVPLGGANSSAESTIFSGQRAVQVENAGGNVFAMAAPQSSGFYDILELLPVATNAPATIAPTLDYGTVLGASVTGFARPYTLVVVFRQLALVSADVTVTPAFAGPTGNKGLINKILTVIQQTLDAQ